MNTSLFPRHSAENSYLFICFDSFWPLLQFSAWVEMEGREWQELYICRHYSQATYCLHLEEKRAISLGRLKAEGSDLER